MNKSVLSVFIFLLLIGYAQAEHRYIKGGKTYKIAEKDALSEIKEKASKTDWKKTLNKENYSKQVKNFKPKNTIKLPETKKRREKEVDMTYSLESDVYDNNGKIAYPKGYTFNPLDYTNLNHMYVVIDGTRKSQIEWFKKTKYYKNINVKLLITDGNFHDLKEDLNQSVFFAFPDFIKRFNVTSTPSVIWQKENSNKISVLEVAI